MPRLRPYFGNGYDTRIVQPWFGYGFKTLPWPKADTGFVDVGVAKIR